MAKIQTPEGQSPKNTKSQETAKPQKIHPTTSSAPTRPIGRGEGNVHPRLVRVNEMGLILVLSQLHHQHGLYGISVYL